MNSSAQLWMFAGIVAMLTATPGQAGEVAVSSGLESRAVLLDQEMIARLRKVESATDPLSRSVATRSYVELLAEPSMREEVLRMLSRSGVFRSSDFDDETRALLWRFCEASEPTRSALLALAQAGVAITPEYRFKVPLNTQSGHFSNLFRESKESGYPSYRTPEWALLIYDARMGSAVAEDRLVAQLDQVEHEFYRTNWALLEDVVFTQSPRLLVYVRELFLRGNRTREFGGDYMVISVEDAAAKALVSQRSHTERGSWLMSRDELDRLRELVIKELEAARADSPRPSPAFP